MTRVADDLSSPFVVSTDAEAAWRLVRDLVALATLPAMWMGAPPTRIGESLLAALDATVRPTFAYLRLTLGDGKLPPVEIFHLHQCLVRQVPSGLGERFTRWATDHDPDDLMAFTHPSVLVPARVSVHSLGPDGSSGVLAAGFTAATSPTDTERVLLNLGANQAVVACKNATLQLQAEAATREARALYEVSSSLAAELDLETVVQTATDAACALTGAQFAAFFYNVTDPSGERYTLYTLSGAPRSAFERFGMPRNTPLFAPTFDGTAVVRIDDVLADPRYGTMAPHHGMPEGHLPVRSYLAVPVRSRSGEVIGGMFFGHARTGVFDDQAERIAVGVAQQAAVAIDNARLFATAEKEIQQRKHAEERYRRLADLLPVAVYTCEAPSGTISYFNARAAEAWGRAPAIGDTDERFCGSSMMFLPDGTPLRHEDCPMAVALHEGRSFRNTEVVIERPDGRRVTALVNIDPVRDESGAVVGAINVFLDVTALKQAERALHEQKQDLETLLETLPIGVFIAHDPECHTIVGNRAAYVLLRMPRGANLSKTEPGGFGPSHFRVRNGDREVEPSELPVQRAARGEVVEAEEIRIEFDDGTVRWALISARPLFDGAGRTRGAVACILDITEMKEAEHALRDGDRRKDHFLATLAHELRNPLAPIRSAVDILREAENDPSLVRLARESIGRQTDQLVRLVDDLLDVSRITRDRLELRRSRVTLLPIVERAIDACRHLAQAEGQSLELRAAGGDIHLDADPVRLTQVLGNLLHNACKYTPRGGTIRVTVERRDAEAIVTVEDDGVGIPAHQLEGIFEMFTQLDETLDRSRGGLGIGLTLVRRLVELHGGTIVAESEGLGRGSKFTVRLPSLLDAQDGDVPTRSEAQREVIPRRVLVVDDNHAAAELMALLLRRAGHDVRLAHDGGEAIDVAEAFQPDVILLDIGLPTLDGLEVCRRIRSRAWGAGTFIVAVSGWGQEKDRREAVEAGFDEHLVKPVASDTIRVLLSSRLTRRDR